MSRLKKRSALALFSGAKMSLRVCEWCPVLLQMEHLCRLLVPEGFFFRSRTMTWKSSTIFLRWTGARRSTFEDVLVVRGPIILIISGSTIDLLGCWQQTTFSLTGTRSMDSQSSRNTWATSEFVNASCAYRVNSLVKKRSSPACNVGERRWFQGYITFRVCR